MKSGNGKKMNDKWRLFFKLQSSRNSPPKSEQERKIPQGTRRRYGSREPFQKIFSVLSV